MWIWCGLLMVDVNCCIVYTNKLTNLSMLVVDIESSIFNCFSVVSVIYSVSGASLTLDYCC